MSWLRFVLQNNLLCMIIFKSQWVGCAAGSIMSDFVSLATVHSADHICIIIIIIIIIIIVVVIIGLFVI